MGYTHAMTKQECEWQTFKFRNFSGLFFTAILLPAPTIIAAIELIQTGSVDLYRMSDGRVSIPQWLTLLASGPFFLLTFVTFTRHAIAWIWRGYEFRLREHSIYVRGQDIPRAAISGYRESFTSGVGLETEQGTIFFNPDLCRDGKRSFENFMDVDSLEPAEPV